MTLDQLKSGQKARIIRINNKGQLGQRLLSLGLLEGTAVSLLRRALGGDPIEIDVMGKSSEEVVEWGGSQLGGDNVDDEVSASGI